ncbi:MgtC/SapB family protein [Altericista sp. CCNU0014]|uniref:MgtC/SapB family protein n=1 Tax=Altericista sp. CCNU0014 TaxID=3082949 RepID=UPI00384A63CC
MGFHEFWDTGIRLLVAVIVGGLIGWNRQIAGKPAGLRTHMLVSLGAALIVLIPLQVNPDRSAEGLSRAVQGVATGIGFLGAGEILQRQSARGDRKTVKGLTSAAALWTTAALGMVSGCGLWPTSLIGTLLVLFILITVKRLEEYLIRDETDL